MLGCRLTLIPPPSPDACLLACLQYARPGQVFLGAGLGVALQVALGAPFLLTYPTSYISRAFEFTRVSRVCVVCLLVRENPSLPRALW